MKTSHPYNFHCRMVYSFTSTVPVEKTEEKVNINTRGGRKKGGGHSLNNIFKDHFALFHIA